MKLKKIIQTIVIEYLNEYNTLTNNNNYITLYHGGYIDKLYSPIHLSQDYYMAKSYDNNIYTFLLNKNSNILDLTNLNTFIKIKSKIYDNYSEKYLLYRNFGGFSYPPKESVLNSYNIIKKYKNYNEIKKRYEELNKTNFIKQVELYSFDEVRNYYEKLSDKQKKIMKEFWVIENEINNMNKQDDYSLNMFGNYFVDYCKKNNFDGYKAISTYNDGVTKGIEYCITNINKLKLE